jgi:hypothetical protein
MGFSLTECSHVAALKKACDRNKVGGLTLTPHQQSLRHFPENSRGQTESSSPRIRNTLIFGLVQPMALAFKETRTPDLLLLIM